MRGITIRFGDATYQLVKNEAAREGITISAFIREAALGRVVINQTRRGNYQGQEQALAAVKAFLDNERRQRLHHD